MLNKLATKNMKAIGIIFRTIVILPFILALAIAGIVVMILDIIQIVKRINLR